MSLKMNDKMTWHTFQSDISAIPVPERFTYPFHYTPHPLCVKAAQEVQAYLKKREDWEDELRMGKMFGVLVAKDVAGQIGYLAAFSGILAGSNVHPFFVPPVFDLLQPHGFFKQGEAEISEINQQLSQIENLPAYRDSLTVRNEAQESLQKRTEETKLELKEAKLKRDALRISHPEDAILKERLEKESQFQKAECKRELQKLKEILTDTEKSVKGYQNKIEELKKLRKQKSAALQKELFQHFRILNAQGEETDVATLFSQTGQLTPPAGTGECAAPKLLQYAYKNDLHPVAMAEFWWGGAPDSTLRRHRAYYPACQSKCGPLLKFMLQGLAVEDNPLVQTPPAAEDLPVVYEDDDIMVINKPEGLLSVPGKEDVTSVYNIVKRMRPEATGPLIVHRLDQATSGLMVITKNAQAYQQMQMQFLTGTIRKRYIAIVEKEMTTPQGCITLRLREDPFDRPRQMASTHQGKKCLTEYHVLDVQPGKSRIAFYPHTGRTHQLRVHSAHPLGLNAPIWGDKLYGSMHTEGRLHLHADYIKFKHPSTLKEMEFEISTPF